MKILQAIRLAQTWQNPPPIASPLSFPGRRRVVSMQSHPKNASHQQIDDKDKKPVTQNPNDRTGDVMSHSFGEGYATRSDEEGFGGIYGGNTSDCNPSNESHKSINESHPDYDRTQGSEVSETEKGRNRK